MLESPIERRKLVFFRCSQSLRAIDPAVLACSKPFLLEHSVWIFFFSDKTTLLLPSSTDDKKKHKSSKNILSCITYWIEWSKHNNERAFLSIFCLNVCSSVTRLPNGDVARSSQQKLNAFSVRERTHTHTHTITKSAAGWPERAATHTHRCVHKCNLFSRKQQQLHTIHLISFWIDLRHTVLFGFVLAHSPHLPLPARA